MRIKNRYIRFSYAALTLLLLSGLMIALLSPYINPRIIWIAALFGLAFPVLWFLNLLNLAFSLFVGKRIFLITLIYLLAGTPMMLRHFDLSLKRGCGENKTNYSLMSYNVKNFDGIAGKDKYETQQTIHDFINKRGPDIVCFQEYSMKGSKHAPFFKNLMESLHQDYRQLSDYNASDLSTQSILVTASKHPIINEGIVYSPDNEIFAIYSDIQLNSDTLRVFNIHLQSIKLIKEKGILQPNRKQLISTTIFGKIRSTLYKLRKAFYIRSYQSLVLAEAIKKSPHPVMVAGDFNDTPSSFAYQIIGDSLRDVSFLRINGFKPTYAESDYPLVIDHIFADKRLSNCNYRRLQIKLSDHYPIITDFSFRDRRNK
ncbi:MAG: endonuclease/exonuclease/phosphatase family protein [Lentimicrobium sp.]|nr:endonuclease/exonuclease/phosphatase family protein [Lentimicrobium sp.]